MKLFGANYQKWSRGHKAQGQGRKKISRPRPRTDPLEAKAKNTNASVLQKKKYPQNFFLGDLYLKKPKKRSLQIFHKVSGVFQRNFSGSKIVLSSSRGQGNFRGLDASKSRPRTSKCVLEDSTSANYAFFAQHLLTTKLISHAFPKSPIPQQ